MNHYSEHRIATNKHSQPNMLKSGINKALDALSHTGLRHEEAEYLHGIARITHAPIPKTAQLLIISFMLFFLFALLWATLSKVDIVSPAQGKSIASSRLQLIQAPQLALVASIHVKEGQRVNQGQLLVELDKTQLDSEHRDAKAHVTQLSTRQQRIQTLIKAAQADDIPDTVTLLTDTQDAQVIEHSLAQQVLQDAWAIYAAELRSLHSKQASRSAAVQRIAAEKQRLQRLIPYSRKTVQRVMRLYKTGGVPLSELEQAKEELADRESHLQTLHYQLKEAEAELAASANQINAHRERFLSEQSLALTETRQALAAAKEQALRRVDLLQQYELKAPVAGIVKDVAIHTQGGVVQPAEVLMQVVPDDVPLEVEAKILNRDIGFVHAGQQVNVKVDTFNFTKYGAIPGIITHVARDASDDEQLGPVYKALIELKYNSVNIGQRSAQLVPGMTMTVDIHIGERRLIEYLLNPVLRYKNEVMRER